MDVGYPKYISEDFPGLNTTISAALHKDGESFFVLFFVVLVFYLHRILVV